MIDNLSRYNLALYEFEGVVTDEEDLNLVTNVTIHVVDPQDQTNIIMKYVCVVYLFLSIPIKHHFIEPAVCP